MTLKASNIMPAFAISGSVTLLSIRHAPATAMSASAIRKMPAPSLHPAEPNLPSTNIAPVSPASTAAAFPSRGHGIRQSDAAATATAFIAPAMASTAAPELSFVLLESTLMAVMRIIRVFMAVVAYSSFVVFRVPSSTFSVMSPASAHTPCTSTQRPPPMAAMASPF